ncbi:TIGR03085 family metal-binding protein [Streptacidiphilus sp. P02-A3a]|uniref:TIGR03085 family metal-binding protein n=1 Tax=Streptacidiphilus sp. P02-A3a TaxID=2704468 RepID=UPI0015F9479F|nr:TIGR03085 family metal-binding protein [Streptacidiphilus sp. P02-A3a]QMU68595.1 TIGR03085 family protein [Streptacidiphilus sp. P02-A3a]
MSNYARRERLLLVDLLEAVGPDAPTLCEGWKTQDLAAHLVLRERRPDAAGGMFIKPLAARLAKVQGEYTAKPYPELLGLFRGGPPPLSLFGIPGADEAANTVEYYVHGEDVRRAQTDWKPRVLDAEFAEVLWKRLARMATLSGRKAPVGLVLRRPDGQTAVARKGAPVVTVTGEPAELLLFAMGRQAHAQVELEGEADAIARVRTAQLGV